MIPLRGLRYAPRLLIILLATEGTENTEVMKKGIESMMIDHLTEGIIEEWQPHFVVAMEIKKWRFVFQMVFLYEE
jgi:hypothetical protein